MDPPTEDQRIRGSGLPRGRGDGPVDTSIHGGTRTAPPRSRGWTVRTRRDSSTCSGSPAVAGMDPTVITTSPASSGLPRGRGDGPVWLTEESVRAEAPPRSRGWTSRRPQPCTRSGGSPAVAGMDPTTAGHPTPRSWLPRGRGDGPDDPRRSLLTEEAPPRSRGWTGRHPRGDPALLGSPAVAGMDRASGIAAEASSRLPRGRGDGPMRTSRAVGSWRAPPRSRGWTHHTGRGHRQRRGSPAVAGMDPGLRRRVFTCDRLARGRGDGPGGCWV